MKLNSLLIAGIVVLVMINFTGCNMRPIEGSGISKSEVREVSEFTRISASVPGDLMITQGDEYALVIEADDNLLAEIVTRLQNGELFIEKKDPLANLLSKTPIKMMVTLPELEEIDFAGSGTVQSADLKAEDLKIDFAGSGTLDMKNLDAKTLSLDIAGSSEIMLSGQVNDFTVDAAGSADILAGDLYCETCSIEIAGSADATVNVSEELNVDIAGSGDIRYYGDPEISEDIAGTGTVKKIDD